MADTSALGVGPIFHTGPSSAHFVRWKMTEVTRDDVKDTKNELADYVILLHDDQGMTFREIAGHVGYAHSWVYKLYKRRKNALRRR